MNIIVELGSDEALVLFELLAGFFDRGQKALDVASSSDRLALSRLFAALETTLVEPFQPDYKQLIREARGRLSVPTQES